MTKNRYIVEHCGVVILAAGSANRMGAVKQLLNYQGRSLIQNALKAALDAKPDAVAVVVGAHSELVSREIKARRPVVVINPDWQEGMASSIRRGIRAIQKKVRSIDGIIFMVCDQPFVTFSVLNDLLKTQRETGMPIVASSYEGRWGTPALFHRSFFSELSLLKGDTGARKILQENASLVATVDFPAGGIDIDTESDYQQLLQKNQPDD